MTAKEHLEKGIHLYHDEHQYAMAFIEFAKAIEQGNANAYAYLGELLYHGQFTRDGKPDVNGALEYWKQGMDKGDEQCAKLYENHKNERMLNPQKIKFQNGDRYFGDVNAEGKPHGNGHMDYNLNGYYASYDGHWENGKRSGKGHYHQFSKGGRTYTYDYQGEWLDDKEHGQGTSKDSSEKGLHCASVSETYTGGFREGKRHGHGVILADNFDGNFTNGKNRFEGEFENGEIVGHGVWEYANGDRFEGEFSGYSNKNGHGVYTFADGLKFEGEWKNNCFVIETLQADSSQKTPILLITEHHHGFDYSYTGTFLFAAKKGTIHYENAATISKDSDFNMRKAYMDIVEVTSDSVTYTVRGDFTKDGKTFNDTIQRGETKMYNDSRECTATIYDEDYDYTVESRIQIICK